MSAAVGMGKTIVCAALILANKQPVADSAARRAAIQTFKSRSVRKRTRGDKQNFGNRHDWQQPPEKVLAYRMQNMTRRVQEFDQVLGKFVTKEKEVEEKVRDPDNDTPNLEYAAWTAPPERIDIDATLVIAPASLIGQWSDELRKFAPGLTVLIFQGNAKGQVIAQIVRVPHELD
jgi:hypothetical protein